MQQAAGNSRALERAPGYVTSLTANLVSAAPKVQGLTWTGLVQNLQIEARPNPQGMMNFGVGSDVRCAYGPGDRDQTRIVEFHNPTGRYSRGQPIARACPHWGPKKCSRTVTFMGMSFTANRGYPRCPVAWDNMKMVEVEGESVPTRVGAPALGNAADDIPDSRQEGLTAADRQQGTHTGIFTVRIWGNFCLGGGFACRSLKDTAISYWAANQLNRFGYGATFSPAPNCGPARWPTPELQAAGAPRYAEWCDVTVDVRR